MSLRTAIKYEVELGNTKCFTWKDAPTINPIINTIAEEDAEFSSGDWVYSERLKRIEKNYSPTSTNLLIPMRIERFTKTSNSN